MIAIPGQHEGYRARQETRHQPLRPLSGPRVLGHTETMTASDFFALHVPGNPFVLANAWDVASALALREAGFPAVGTTSAGVAAAAGVADEHTLTRPINLALLAAIGRFESAPMLTVDMENGYSEDPAEVVAAVDELVATTSAVRGINIEDAAHGALVDPQIHIRRIEAIKDKHPDLYVNARTDVFWTNVNDLAEAKRRISMYVDAGADGIFVPGMADAATIEAVCTHSPKPVNVLASPVFSRDHYAQLGVARISTGSLLYRTALASAVATATAYAGTDTAEEAAARGAYTYPEVRALVG